MTASAEELRALADLHTALGQPGSGRLRYASAMYFHRRGGLSDEALEVYRVCSARDGDDPVALLNESGLSDSIPPAPRPDRETSVRALLDEIDRYLADLTGPGIAETRAGLAEWRHAPIRPEPMSGIGPLHTHLTSSLASLSDTHSALAAAIGAAAPQLSWRVYESYSDEEIGAAFRTGHTYASLIGEGAIFAPDFDLGLFLIAPGLLYRDHAHPAPELYVPLTGPHGWRFAPGAPLVIKSAHEAVWNDPEVPHLTKVGPLPFLCIYCWTKDVNEPARIVPAQDWDALERVQIEG